MARRVDESIRGFFDIGRAEARLNGKAEIGKADSRDFGIAAMMKFEQITVDYAQLR